jgi:hypothetical protein
MVRKNAGMSAWWITLARRREKFKNNDGKDRKGNENAGGIARL